MFKLLNFNKKEIDLFPIKHQRDFIIKVLKYLTILINFIKYNNIIYNLIKNFDTFQYIFIKLFNG